MGRWGWKGLLEEALDLQGGKDLGRGRMKKTGKQMSLLQSRISYLGNSVPTDLKIPVSSIFRLRVIMPRGQFCRITQCLQKAMGLLPKNSPVLQHSPAQSSPRMLWLPTTCLCLYPTESACWLHDAVAMVSLLLARHILLFSSSVLSPFLHSPSAEVFIWFECETRVIFSGEASTVRRLPPLKESSPFLLPLHRLRLSFLQVGRAA